MYVITRMYGNTRRSLTYKKIHRVFDLTRYNYLFESHKKHFIFKTYVFYIITCIVKEYVNPKEAIGPPCISKHPRHSIKFHFTSTLRPPCKIQLIPFEREY